MMRESRNQSLFHINGLHIRSTHFVRGNFPCGAWTNYPVNRLLMLTATGNGAIGDRQQSYELEKGMSYFLPANHEVYVEFDERVHFISIHFNLELFCGEDIFSHLPGVVVRLQPSEQQTRADALFDEANELQYHVKLKALLYELASELVPLLPDGIGEVSAKWADFTPIQHLLSRDFSASVTVDMLADAMGMRREVFSRRFKALIGVTPKQFMTRLLVQRAMELLATHELPVYSVAKKLGFNNEFYFSRFFKKHVGTAPAKFQPDFRR